MQAWQVEFRRPDGDYGSWVVLDDSSDVTPELAVTIRETILQAHRLEFVQILSIRHVDRAIISKRDRPIVEDRCRRGIG